MSTVSNWLPRGQAGHRGQVEGAIDRPLVVDIVGAGDDDHVDTPIGEASQLGDAGLDGAARLGVGVEEVSADERSVDPGLEALIDGSGEGRGLPLALRHRGRGHIRMARTEMDIREMEQ